MGRVATTKLTITLLLLGAILLLASLSLGSSSFELSLLFSSEQQQNIVLQLRLPRTLVAIGVGCLLATSGCAMQGLFRNALADPSIIGVGAGASLGASLFIFFSAQLAPYSIGHIGSLGGSALGASFGGALAVLAVYHIAKHRSYVSVSTMLLAGMALSALAAGINQLLQFFSTDQILRQMSLWHMGSLSGSDWLRAVSAISLAALCFVLLYRQARVLNIFLLGESEARHLGIKVEQSKHLLIVVVAVATGSALALAGSIVFIGLIIPHLCRLLVGPDHRILLPVSAVCGALLLLAADIGARLLLAPSELPVGLLIAFIGAPFFLVLLRKRPAYSY
ncbi:FecCD family ABC transporter permease [Agaribacterium haliotis]|uniref:FecCD family ABC transporter permease n=1 Tax=Agaribacterium haliotis TaxID=2013869 RepID=UPI000BB531C5|nr:iron ABC transporter permease [Agaribacterium haliotis]